MVNEKTRISLSNTGFFRSDYPRKEEPRAIEEAVKEGSKRDSESIPDIIRKAFIIREIRLGKRRIVREGKRRVILIPPRIARLLEENGIVFVDVVLYPFNK